MNEPNLSTDAAATAAYDEPGSWGRMSEGWPDTPYTIGKWLLCTKAEVVPYGQYVVVGATHNSDPDFRGERYDYSNAVIRVATEALKTKLEKTYQGLFIECGAMLADEPVVRDDVLEAAATICEDITTWGLPPTKAEVARSTQQFCAKAIRAQKQDSRERLAHEAKEPT